MRWMGLVVHMGVMRLSENLKGRNHLKILSTDERIILE
jgi:hypothetical protein